MNGLQQLPGRRPAFALLALATIVLVGCGTVEPLPQTYILGSLPTREAATVSMHGRPIVEVRPVRVPDYLDVSDLLIRKPGNRIEASPTGRWAERLSVGVTRALTGALTRRLPEFLVTDSALAEQAKCRVLVDVEAFERRADGPAVLDAHWSVVDNISGDAVSIERVSLSSPVNAPGDAALVHAMSLSLENLAERVEAGIRGAASTCSGRSSMGGRP